MRSSWPAARSASQARAVMRLCQTMAGATGSAGRAIPDDRRLALVGDADGGDAARRRRASPRPPARDRELALPDVLGVVRDVAGGGEALGELLLGGRDGRRRSGRTTIARDEVVPWSSARTRSRAAHRAATGSRRAVATGAARSAARSAPGRARRTRATPSRGRPRPRPPAAPRPSRARRRGAPRPAARSRRRGRAGPSRGASGARARRRG